MNICVLSQLTPPCKSVSKLEDSVSTLKEDCQGSRLNPDSLSRAWSPCPGVKRILPVEISPKYLCHHNF